MNVEEFDNNDSREGSKQDVLKMEALLKQIGFNITTLQKRIDRGKFLKAILEFSEDKTHGDIMILVVMSHGQKGGDSGKIITSDDFKVDIENDIIRYICTVIVCLLNDKERL